MTEPAPKRLARPPLILSPHYSSLEAISKLRAALADAQNSQARAGAEAATDGLPAGAALFAEPFATCSLSQALAADIVEELTTAVDGISMVEKHSDLLCMHQSVDLCQAAPEGILADLRAFLTGELLVWMRQVTGIPLNDRVDIFAARYSTEDFLLCHDDELDDRRIAYILYLVPEDWSEADGGSLDLFAVEATGQPTSVVKSLVPAAGRLVFFNVSERSFHQVAEVVGSRDRLSITGWFHGPPLERQPPPPEPSPELHPFFGSADTIGEAAIMEEWCKYINEDYLDAGSVLNMSQIMEEESTIHLSDFLKPEIYTEVVRELEATQTWATVGPANICHLQTLAPEAQPLAVADLFRFLRSHAFFRFLHQITELDLLTWTGSVARLGPGSYTLCRDTDPMLSQAALDVMLTCVDLSAGMREDTEVAETIYLAMHEEEPIIKVGHVSNGLTLVYREPQVPFSPLAVGFPAEDLQLSCSPKLDNAVSTLPQQGERQDAPLPLFFHNMLRGRIRSQ